MSPPPKNREEARNRNRYSFYVLGWTDGAALHAMDPECTNHKDPDLKKWYDIGYQHGRDARIKAKLWAEKKFGYHPMILRAQEPLKFMKMKKRTCMNCGQLACNNHHVPIGKPCKYWSEHEHL